MTSPVPRHDGRGSHVTKTDELDRRAKADKIRAIVEPVHPLEGAAVLEIGTGSGWMAHQFAAVVGDAGSVTSVDVVDERRVTDGYRFCLVDSTDIPMEDGSVDVAVSNHVLEHVGDRRQQAHHLAELRRVLAPTGLLYLAVPNRWRLFEAHFRLPFLSWLPQRLADWYVRVTGRGDWFDVTPPSRRELLELLAGAGLDATDQTLEVPRLMAVHEQPSLLTRLAARLPTPVLRTLRLVVPTLVVIARPTGSAVGPGVSSRRTTTSTQEQQRTGEQGEHQEPLEPIDHGDDQAH